MNTKQVIAVIGASGNMGSAFAKALSKTNCRILLHSPNKPKVQLVLKAISDNYPETDAEIINDLIEMCWEADIVILAIPYAAEKQVAESIRSVVNQKIIGAVSIPLSELDQASLISRGTSAGEELQELLPNAKVVKLFNIELENNYYQAGIAPRKTDYFIAGNDKEALNTVSDLVTAAGFHPVVAGNLSTGRTLENMQFLIIQLNKQSKFNCLQQ